MATRTQIRRGTTTDNNNFKGFIGELTMDTTTKGLRIHDGSTTGGYKIDTLVAYQAPTSSNGYKWYRKYASGWVEQGGVILDYNTGGWQASKYITLPIAMIDNKYVVQWTNAWTNYTSEGTAVASKETTQFKISNFTSYGDNMTASWLVIGRWQ